MLWMHAWRFAVAYHVLAFEVEEASSAFRTAFPAVVIGVCVLGMDTVAVFMRS